MRVYGKWEPYYNRMYDKWFTFIFIVLSESFDIYTLLQTYTAHTVVVDAHHFVYRVCLASVKLYTCYVFFWFRGLNRVCFLCSRMPITKKCEQWNYFAVNVWLIWRWEGFTFTARCEIRENVCAFGMQRAFGVGWLDEKEVLAKGVRLQIRHYLSSAVDDSPLPFC